jgi:hypothetical protein
VTPYANGKIRYYGAKRNKMVRTILLRYGLRETLDRLA